MGCGPLFENKRLVDGMIKFHSLDIFAGIQLPYTMLLLKLLMLYVCTSVARKCYYDVQRQMFDDECIWI